MNRWALVTGAAKRLGRIIALDLANAGWNIVIHYNKSSVEAQSLANEIKALGADACLAELDLQKTSLVRKLIPSLLAEFPSLRAVINNASLFETDEFDPTGQRHYLINQEAPRVLAESFHQHQNESLTSTVINILDAAPYDPNFQSYNKSKLALYEFTLSQAINFAPRTRVNGVALGLVLKNQKQSSQHFQNQIKKTPLRYNISPEDVTACVRLLIDNKSLTGNILYADSGLHLRQTRS